jgi:hypothetical protein
MIFNFNVAIFDLNTQPLKDDQQNDVTINKIIAGLLVNQSKGNALKFYDWAQKLHNGQNLDIDKSDVKILSEFIETNEQLTILAKAQILDILYSPGE